VCVRLLHPFETPGRTQQKETSSFGFCDPLFRFETQTLRGKEKITAAAPSDKLKIDQLAAFLLNAQQHFELRAAAREHHSDLVDSTRRLYCLRQLCTFVINLNPGNKQRNYMGRAVIKRWLDRLLCVHTQQR
jgi:hypothetical protein